jgi:hypothetical protein
VYLVQSQRNPWLKYKAIKSMNRAMQKMILLEKKTEESTKWAMQKMILLEKALKQSMNRAMQRTILLIRQRIKQVLMEPMPQMKKGDQQGTGPENNVENLHYQAVGQRHPKKLWKHSRDGFQMNPGQLDH